MAALDLFGLEGKKALIIGGGQGMGESSARLLALAGCDVAIVDVLAERAERVAGVVRGLGRKGVAIAANVLDDHEAEQAVGEAEHALGGLDVMVSIVGQALFTPIVDMSPEDWDSDQRRNLRYFFVAARLVAKSMIRRAVPGAMVCIASTDGIQGAPFHASYGAAKAGLIHLAKSMAVEWATHGIRVNVVVPGTITTPRLPDTEKPPRGDEGQPGADGAVRHDRRNRQGGAVPCLRHGKLYYRARSAGRWRLDGRQPVRRPQDGYQEKHRKPP